MDQGSEGRGMAERSAGVATAAAELPGHTPVEVLEHERYATTTAALPRRQQLSLATETTPRIPSSPATSSPALPTRVVQGGLNATGEGQRSKKRKSPCVSMPLFRSPLSRMMLSPRVQISPRMRLLPRRSPCVSMPSSSGGLRQFGGIDLNAEPTDEIVLNVETTCLNVEPAEDFHRGGPLVLNANLDLNVEPAEDFMIAHERDRWRRGGAYAAQIFSANTWYRRK